MGAVVLMRHGERQQGSASPVIEEVSSSTLAETPPIGPATVFELPADWAPDAKPHELHERRARPVRSADNNVPDCEPPYYYENGIKKYKPQCLHR